MQQFVRGTVSELRAIGIEITMKISTFFACLIPELRKLSGPQFMKIWSACAPCSRNWLYFHLLLLLACCSLIFNVIIRVNASPVAMLLGLALGLALPANIYFFVVFNRRRQALRQYIEENWEEFRPQ